MPSFRHILIPILSACLVFDAGAQTESTRPGQVVDEYWKDPQFLKEFIGSYGILSASEPTITSDERLFMQHLFGVIETNRVAGMEKIQQALDQGTIEFEVAPLEEREPGRRSRKSDLEERTVTLSNPATFHLTLANLQVQEGMTTTAVTHYQNAISAFPNFLRAHKNLGVILVQEGRFAEAQKSLIRTLELGGNDGNVYGLLGTCYLANDRIRSAEMAFNEAMLLAPDKKEWRLGAARALLYQERFEQAAALFGELIQDDPDEPQYWLFQANCHIGLNQPLKAAYNYEMIRELGAADGRILRALGDIYLSRDMPDLALDTYLAALSKENAEGIDDALKKAEVLAARRAVDQSATLLEEIRRVGGGQLNGEQELKVLKLESRIALAEGADDAAARLMEEILSKDPMDGDIMMLLAGHYAKKANHEKATVLYQRAAGLEGFEAEARVKHAQMLVGMKRYQRAIDLLQEAQQIRPRENVGKYLEGVQKIHQAVGGDT